MVNAARRILAGRGLSVARHLTGSLVTSLDMAGCSLTVSLLDESADPAVGRSGQDGRPVLVINDLLAPLRNALFHHSNMLLSFAAQSDRLIEMVRRRAGWIANGAASP